jgi:MFS family permease
MDRVLLLAGRGARAFGFGFAAVLIGLHLERRGLPAPLIGVALGVALAAASLLGLASAYVAARFGRRPALAICGVLMALAGIDLALGEQAVWLIAAGLTGMLGVAGVDLGPFASVEQAALTEAVPPDRRNLAFARYSLTAGLFNAAGGLAAALADGEQAMRAFFLLYAVIGLMTAVLPAFMSPRVEAELRVPAFGVLRRTDMQRVLAGLTALFALDSFAGGFVSNAVISYWLHIRFGAEPALLGPVFGVVAVLQSLSYEVSGRLSDRVGLINTMVFTHLPSNVLLKLAALFMLDAFAGGMVVQSLIAYWFALRFGVAPALLGGIFFGANLLAGASALAAGRLARRFGLVATMVGTHLPSNVLLILVALSPTLPVAIGLLFGRFLLSQMDVPARQAYVVSIVPAADRAAAVAITGAVRGVAQAFGPPLAGLAIAAAAFGVPFYAGGGLKIVYDLGLYAAFRRRRAEHETALPKDRSRG